VAVARARTAGAVCQGPLTDGSFNSWHVAAFPGGDVGGIARPFRVVWDGWTDAQGDPIRDLSEHFQHPAELRALPPYAPMLNPIEFLWSWLKGERAEQLRIRETPTRSTAG